MPDTQSAVARREEQQADKTARLAKYVKEQVGPQLMRVLPKHIPEDRMVRIAVSACRGNSDLLDATPLSLAGALLTAATLGLEPNTPNGECYLAPFRNKKAPGQPMEAALIVGYQGYVKLFRQHPLGGPIWADAVYPEDEFWWQRGTDPKVHHVPRPEARAATSKPTHYCAYAIPKGASRAEFVVLTADEVKTLRQGREGPRGDIADPQRWMERKTAIRQLVKLLPKSAEMALAATVDESSGGELYARAQRVQAERADLPATAALEQPGEPPADGKVEDPPPGGEGL